MACLWPPFPLQPVGPDGSASGWLTRRLLRCEFEATRRFSTGPVRWGCGGVAGAWPDGGGGWGWNLFFCQSAPPSARGGGPITWGGSDAPQKGPRPASHRPASSYQHTRRDVHSGDVHELARGFRKPPKNEMEIRKPVESAQPLPRHRRPCQEAGDDKTADRSSSFGVKRGLVDVLLVLPCPGTDPGTEPGPSLSAAARRVHHWSHRLRAARPTPLRTCTPATHGRLSRRQCFAEHSEKGAFELRLSCGKTVSPLSEPLEWRSGPGGTARLAGGR